MTDADLRDASVESLFASAGALLDGHFLLKSGRHAGRYLEKFLVLQHPRYGVEICRRFAEVLGPYSPTLVVGPTTGGVLLSFETARQLGGSVRAAFAEPVASGGRALAPRLGGGGGRACRARRRHPDHGRFAGRDRGSGAGRGSRAGCRGGHRRPLDRAG